MSECSRCQEWLKEAIYGDLKDRQRRALAEHLRGCTSCRMDYEDLVSTASLMAKRERPEPPAEFWDGYWDRLSARLQGEDRMPVRSPGWWLRWRKLGPGLPRWSYQTAAAAALVVFGIILGRMFFSPSGRSAEPGLTTEAGTSPRVTLAERTQDYLLRSKLVLLAIANFDAEAEDPYALDLDYQQQTSRQLVQEASLLKQEFSGVRHQRLQELIHDLEIVLLQIANMEPGFDPSLIEIIQDGVQSRGIFFKMYLVDSTRSWEELEAEDPASKESDKTWRF